MTNHLISRKEAKEQGLKHYFTGIPCIQGHISNRLVSCCKCVDCCNVWRIDNPSYNKEWRENNPEYDKQHYIQTKEIRLERSSKWFEEHPDYQKQWGYEHKEYYQILGKQWRKDNPHKVNEQTKLRNTKLEQAIPIWYEEELVKQLYQKRDELNELWGTNFVVDHIIPLNPRNRSVSGLHCWANLQLLDSSLNGSKKDKYETDW